MVSIHVAWQYQFSVKGENNQLCVVCVARTDTGVTTVFKSESFTFPCQKTQENYEEHGIGIQFNTEFGYPSVRTVRFPVRLFVLPALGWKAEGISLRAPLLLCRDCQFLHTRQRSRYSRTPQFMLLNNGLINSYVRPWKNRFFILIKKNDGMHVSACISYRYKPSECTWANSLAYRE